MVMRILYDPQAHPPDVFDIINAIIHVQITNPVGLQPPDEKVGSRAKLSVHMYINDQILHAN